MNRAARAGGPLVVLVVFLALAGCRTGGIFGEATPTPDAGLVVAAASDLRPAFQELGRMFTEETGRKVVFQFGSSGQLAQQIIEGSPVDLFASADVSFVDRVIESGRGDPSTKTTYARGRIVIWARADRWRGWEDLADLVSDPEVRFVAIANPDHAPYGVAARQALEAAGVWERIQPRLAYGENIADTQRLAAVGDADAAIVALSLAISAGEDGRWVAVDPGLYQPLEQVLVVVAETPDRAAAASAFARLVSSPEGREVMSRYGFDPPGDT